MDSYGQRLLSGSASVHEWQVPALNNFADAAMFVAAALAIVRAPNHSLQADDAHAQEKQSIAHADAEARRFRLVERDDGSALPWSIASKTCDAVPSASARRGRIRRARAAARRVLRPGT